MSFIGHLIETFIMKSNSGILLGWWTPIYGIGSVVIILINKYITKLNINKISKVILLFISCSFILTLIEALGGYLIEFIFNITGRHTKFPGAASRIFFKYPLSSKVDFTMLNTDVTV